MFDPIAYLRRRERFEQSVKSEMGLFLRRHGAEALSQIQAKLQRSDLTTHYRQILEAAAKRVGKMGHPHQASSPK